MIFVQTTFNKVIISVLGILIFAASINAKNAFIDKVDIGNVNVQVNMFSQLAFLVSFDQTHTAADQLPAIKLPQLLQLHDSINSRSSVRFIKAV